MASAEARLSAKQPDIGVEDLSALNNSSLEPEGMYRARSYQLEMLEESMKRNIIVAAETGSGKTFIAVLRIQAELEKCPPEKLVWFCVPTVALAIQQHKVVSTKLPAFQTRILSSLDKVELWTEQWIWDEILKGIRIVVSTHQVLLDALTHGFIRINQLALMIFDEAHSCVGNHPSSRILRNFYHTSTSEDRPVILGLTASPVVNSKIGSLETLENNLNAISRTPKLHREELLQFVYQPVPVRLMYPPNRLEPQASPALESLKKMYEGLDIEQDPWIIDMRSDPRTCDSKALVKALTNHKTYCNDQIKGLYDRALAIHSELGSSATDHYIQQCLWRFQGGTADGTFTMESLDNNEKAYLRRKFGEVQISNEVDGIPRVVEYTLLSPKVKTLVEFLRRENPVSFSGLVFVQTRAEVAVLSHILSIHARSFQVSTFVGASSFSGRKNTVSELADLKGQKNTLDDLRHGRKNLIVTTNALEEGIDVSRCSVVICFHIPPNLKSFIQRRGRARKSNSKYVIMFEDGPESEAVATWTTLEAQMREIYMDDMRHVQEIQELEALEEDRDIGEHILFIKSTGARITIGDAVQHLYHFCATLPAEPYVDLSPVFTFEDYSHDRNYKDIKATVILPNSVDASVRRACGISQWRTEKMAKRDAAFEAYKALYHKGLVNENLLPLGHIDEGVDEAYAAVEKRPSLVGVSDQIDPWQSVARKWQESNKILGSTIKIKDQGEVIGEAVILVPCQLPDVPEFDLHWDVTTTFRVVIAHERRDYDRSLVASAMQATLLLLKSVFKSRLDGRDDFTALFVPPDAADLQSWIQTHSGAIKATDMSEKYLGADAGLIRDISQSGTPYIFRDVRYVSYDNMLPDGYMELDHCETEGVCPATGVDDSMDLDDSGARVLLEVTKLPKKIDFLHPSSGPGNSRAEEPKLKMLNARYCEMDKLSFENFSRFAMFIPSILHKIQVAMVVESLCQGVLLPLQFGNRDLVATAISASSAKEVTNYQRLEFYGDSMLKFLTSLTLMARHLSYHEGILSHKKDHIVSNSSLASAAIKKGLDGYILTKAFTGRKWRPTYNSAFYSNQPGTKREMSSKTLADVVEALIGAACLDGGLQKAIGCLAIFLPHVPWSFPGEACQTLCTVYDYQVPSCGHLAQVEQLISYRFNATALLVEALTHPSHQGPNSGASYQRLEFMGDSVLDKIVTATAFAHEPPIPTHDLHLIRTALVNGNFLSFLCLKLCTSFRRSDPVTGDYKTISTVEVPYKLYLWQTMRHASSAVHAAQKACLARFEDLHMALSESFRHGSCYPWSSLARLQPDKFFSDIVESLLGAIYIDTQGSLAECQAFLEHLGLMPYLRRVMEEDVALLHPKEELGQLANQDRVNYRLGNEGEEGQERMTCTVLVGEREVVSLGDGIGSMEVQTRAADAACKILRGEATCLSSRSCHGQKEARMDVQAKEEIGEDDEEVERSLEEGNEGDSDVYMTADEQ